VGEAIICCLGIDYRRGEELPLSPTLANLRMPILNTIHGLGLMECGSFAWLNPEMVVVDIRHCSEMEGDRQIGELLKIQGVNLHLTENLG
jgi:N-dimethylarginine dimethylaminohydrolase